MGLFSNKTAIITGGASGIGAALAQELARRGAIVTLADVNAGLLEETAAGIVKAGGKAKAVILDVTDLEAVKKLVADTVSEYGRLDYIFNNAGVVVFAEARDYDYLDDWRKIIDVDLYGPVNGVVAAYPVMIKQGFGHIVNTASLAGLMPCEPFCSYSAAKHGVVGLSLTLRMEGADLGVKVSVVCPGLIQTPMYNARTINIDQEELHRIAPKGLPPEKCASVILRGVERNKPIIVVTFMARIAWILYRISPGMMLWSGTRIVRHFRKKLRVSD